MVLCDPSSNSIMNQRAAILDGDISVVNKPDVILVLHSIGGCIQILSLITAHVNLETPFFCLYQSRTSKQSNDENDIILSACIAECLLLLSNVLSSSPLMQEEFGQINGYELLNSILIRMPSSLFDSRVIYALQTLSICCQYIRGRPERSV